MDSPNAHAEPLDWRMPVRGQLDYGRKRQASLKSCEQVCTQRLRGSIEVLGGTHFVDTGAKQTQHRDFVRDRLAGHWWRGELSLVHVNSHVTWSYLTRMDHSRPVKI